ncbi:MAG: sugar transferase [Clostridiales bacterium]|nr:sugar transferase [Clostridiales bacterium]
MENTTKDFQAQQNINEDLSVKNFDHTIVYDDQFYDDYISSFVPTKKNKFFYRFVKRAFDIIASSFMIIVFSLFFILIAIIIKCDSKGPAIFKQERIGKNGKVFSCLKFRSMRIDAPKNCATSLLENPDQYYTKVGRFLRKLSLDELPQLFCVFIGTMSFIGYRPLVKSEENCNLMRAKMGVFSMRPGISGYAQVHGRDDVYYKNKAVLDAYYVKNASLWFDIKLFFQTIAVVLKREGNNCDSKK